MRGAAPEALPSTASLDHGLVTIGAMTGTAWKARGMERRVALVAVLIAVLAVSGCASSFPGGQTLPKDLFAAARQSDKAPKGFNDGLSRTSCGEVTLGQGEQAPTAAVNCINSAIGSLDAELAIAAVTTEGDPIVTFYRTSANTPGVEIFTDSQFDRYGPKTWTRENCPKAMTIVPLRGCAEE